MAACVVQPRSAWIGLCTSGGSGVLDLFKSLPGTCLWGIWIPYWCVVLWLQSYLIPWRARVCPSSSCLWQEVVLCVQLFFVCLSLHSMTFHLPGTPADAKWMAQFLERFWRNPSSHGCPFCAQDSPHHIKGTLLQEQRPQIWEQKNY